MNYQLDFHKKLDKVYLESRRQKSEKILSIITDYYKDKVRSLRVLDVGCGTGTISNLMSRRFHQVLAIDINKTMINEANKKFRVDNLYFIVQDGLFLAFPSNTFDLVICNYLCEHVPEPQELLSEIYRTLKPNGLCYFSFPNRNTLIEPHHRLPFLTLMPKFLARPYIKIVKNENLCYEHAFTLKQILKLAKRFQIIDYTLKIIQDPERYHANDMLKPGTLKYKISKRFAKTLYKFIPSYILLLKKAS